jgi:uncharacterized protein YuzE
MHCTYDPASNVAYLRLRRRTGKVTTVVVSAELNVDIAPDGRVYGIKLLNANAQLGNQRELTVENRESGTRIRLALAS